MAKKRSADRCASAAALAGFALMLLVAASQFFGLVGQWALQLTGAATATGSAYARAEWIMGGVNLASVAAVFALPYGVMARMGHGVAPRTPLGRGRVPVAVLLPLFLGAMAAVNSLSGLLQRFFSLVLQLPAPLRGSLPETGFARFLYFLTRCAVAAVLEELVFRGGIQGLLRGFGPRFSLLVTALLFTFMHAGVWELPAVFALSLLLGYVAEIGGSVVPCMVLHFANNAFSFLMLLVQSKMETMAALALTLWLMLAFILMFLGAVWAVRSFRLGPRLKLRRDPDNLGPPVRRAQKLLATPVFSAGAAVVLAHFVLRLFL